RDLYLSVIGQLIEYEKYHAALAHLEQFERLYGSTETSHRFKGDAWLALGQLSEAEREYTAVGSAAMSGYGSHGLGRVAAARDDWARALGYFEEAVRDQPTSANFLNDLGCALYRLGRVEEAEFQLQKALDLAPRNQQVSSNLDALRSDRLERLRPAGAVSGEAVP